MANDDTSALDAASDSIPNGPSATHHKTPGSNAKSPSVPFRAVGAPEAPKHTQAATSITEYDAERRRRG